MPNDKIVKKGFNLDKYLGDEIEKAHKVWCFKCKFVISCFEKKPGQIYHRGKCPRCQYQHPPKK